MVTGIGSATMAAENYPSSPSTSVRKGSTELSPEQQRRVEKLAATDRKVRAHEQAHLSAAGGLATSGIKLEYTTGPDGKRYAVGGEVGIDVSKGRTPEETLQKAEQIRAAALAPADPSGQDRAVAAAAARLSLEARQEQVAKAQAERQGADADKAQAVAAYQQAGGLEISSGFRAQA